MERWSGKVAVVTGASAGIGLEIVKTLVSQGMNVVGLARRKDKMIQELSSVKGPGKFHALECDVSKEKSVIEAFEYIKKTFNSLHVLVNNAGIITMKSIEESDTKELEKVIGVNLMGVLYCTKEAIKMMKQSNEAYIINLSSVAGHKVPNPKWFENKRIFSNVYSATKFAIRALSETCTNELLGQNIRFTNLSPGYVRTEIIKDEVLKDAGLIDIPGLLPKDIADAILYLLGTPTRVQIAELTIKPLGEKF